MTSSGDTLNEYTTTTAVEGLQKGIEQYKSGDFNEAADTLEEVVQQRVDKHGDLGYPCAEAYLWYGKALLEIARAETDHLLFAIKENAYEGSSFSESASKILKTSAVPIDQQKKEKDKTMDLDEGSTDNNEEKEETKQEEQEPEGEGEADVETLQIAWEWLDTARVILSTSLENCKDEEQKPVISFLYSDVLSCLGQLCLETDNVESAVQDLELCLQLRSELLPSTDRTLAETHFFLGMAYQLNNKLTEALAEFDKSKKIINTILSDASVSVGVQHQLKTILGELEIKFSETQQLLSGADSNDNENVKEALNDVLRTKPKPIEAKTDIVVRDMGVFGNTGKKRSRTSTPSEDEPDSKRQKKE